MKMSTVFRTIDGRIVPIKNGKQTDAVKAKVVNPKRPKGFVSNSAHYGISKAFTIPNATCPKCGASVYYYEHPNGARVFFDSLGPPWPKHPCTTTMTVPQSNNNRKQMLENVGWKPLLIKDIASSDTQEGYTVKADAIDTSDTFEIDIKPALMKQKKFKRKGIESLLLYGRSVGENKAEIAVTCGLSDWIMFGRVNREARQQHIESIPRKNGVTEPIRRLIDQKNKNISFTTSAEEDLVVFTLNIGGQKYKFIEDSAKLVRKLRSADQSATSVWYRVAKSSKNYYVTIVNTSINYQKSKSFVPQTREENSPSSTTIKHIGFVEVKKIESIDNSDQLNIAGALIERSVSFSINIKRLMKLTSLDKLFLEKEVIAVETRGDSHILRVRGTPLDVTSFVF
ncbi:hypothetical protein [Vibrio lentus]|uniref:Uncharacterized protein n=2 Tax=Vibrio lentus TaxID=136468 RepID=A0AB36XND8_9VIBR|nr:hypothetical protein [Vibrio lentus]MCC4835007.1 hypothetical protein [Vibrio lentus]PMI17421.1 hypothetical protein BCU51_01455 [Vibrio lentus]PMK48116.1 hypothetical protein BCT99_14700 [Vibrio lentus]PML30952.1 hypothetical protein BCT79_20085 [Vibrio lentus]PMM34051.1 hypothetical protein BCT56_10750 [Vibrio lentus]